MVVTVKLGVEVSMEPIVPEPVLNDTDVVPLTGPPAVCAIAPVVTAVSSTVAPCRVEPIDTPAVPAVEFNCKSPVTVIAPLVVIAPALLITKLEPPVEELGPMLRAEPVPVQLTVPVVFAVKFVVLPVRVVMLPEPDFKFKSVAVIVDAFVWLIVPEPLAVRSTSAPDMSLAKVMPPPPEIDFSTRIPAGVVETVSVVPVVIEESLVTERLANVAPSDETVNVLPIVLATVAEPVVFTVKAVVAVLIALLGGPMAPEPDSKVTLVVELTSPVPTVSSTTPAPLALKVTPPGPVIVNPSISMLPPEVVEREKTLP